MTDLISTTTRRAGMLFGALLAVFFVPTAAQAEQTQICPINLPPGTLPEYHASPGLSADRARLVGHTAFAVGHAHLEKNGQILEGSSLRYDNKTSEISSEEGLKYLRNDGLFMTAGKGRYNLSDHTGKFKDVNYDMLSRGARGKASLVQVLSDDNFQLHQATYSTCPGPKKAWKLTATRIDLDRKTGRGVARNATLRIRGIPVLYTPYISFPIDDKRHTGFLVPTFGHSGDSGYELTTPYYINLAPNYDLTLIPHYMTERGFQLGAKFRYLGRHQRGQVAAEILPYDKKYGAERDLEHASYIQQLTPHTGFRANFSRVSDDDYFDDLSNDLANISTSQLARTFEFNAAWTGARISFLVQDFQTLNQYFSSLGGRFVKAPYRRLPQITVNLLTPTAPFQLGLDAQYTRFSRDESVGADRTDLKPHLTWGVDHGSWYANSEVAYELTYYNLNDLQYVDSSDYIQPTQDNITRQIPSFKADAGLRLSRTLSNGWVQTLEPRIQYLLVGYTDQSGIPSFDTNIATLNYDLLFDDNRFSGIDRIGDANQITVGVSSRFISPHSGRTVARFELGRITSFRDLKVGLPNSGTTGYGDRGSDIVAGAMFSPSEFFTASTTVEYDPDRSRIDRLLATTVFSHDGYRLGLGYRYYRDFRPLRSISGHGDHTRTRLLPGQFETLSQTSVGFQAPIGDRVTLGGQWDYSFTGHRNVSTRIGMEYRPSCCYAARLSWRRYIAHRDGSYDNAIMLQFVLRGLGRFGKSLGS